MITRCLNLRAVFLAGSALLLLATLSARDLLAGNKKPVSLPLPVIDRIEPDAQFPGREVRIFGSGFTAGARRSVLLFYHGDHAVFPAERTVYPRLTYLSDREIRFTIPMGIEPARYGVAVVSAGLTSEHPLTVRPFRYRVGFADLQCIAETSPPGSDDIVSFGTVIADLYFVSRRVGAIEIDSGETKRYSEAGTIAPDIEVGDFLYVAASLYEYDGRAEPRAETFDLGFEEFLTVTYPDITSARNLNTMSRFAFRNHEALVGINDKIDLGFQRLGLRASTLQSRTNNPRRSVTLLLPVFRGRRAIYNVRIRITRNE